LFEIFELSANGNLPYEVTYIETSAKKWMTRRVPRGKRSWKGSEEEEEESSILHSEGI
jgi:hypothetical protein